MSSSRRADVVDVALVVVVGGADQRATQPGQREDRAAPAGGHDRPGHQRQVVGRQRDVRAAAGADAGHLGLVVQLVGAQLVGPHAGGVDHPRGHHLELVAGGPVAHQCPGGATVALHQPADLEPVGAHRAEALGLAEHGEHQPGVVGLAVVEQVAGRRLAGGQRGQQLGHLVAVDDPVAGGAPVRLAVPVEVRAAAPAAPGAQALARHHRIHVQSHAEHAVGALAPERRHHQLERAHQVGSQRDVDRALQQRLAHQAQVELLQVAQPAVHQLGRAAGGAGREVGLLHQRHAVATRGGVQRHPGAGDPAADHQHVELVLGQGGDGVGAGDHPARLRARAVLGTWARRQSAQRRSLRRPRATWPNAPARCARARARRAARTAPAARTRSARPAP